MDVNVDHEKLLNMVQGSYELLAQVLAAAHLDWGLQLEKFDKAIAVKDFDQMRTCLHRLNGSVRNFHCSELVNFIGHLEHAAERKSSLNWSEASAEIKIHLSRLQAEVEKLIQRGVGTS